MVDRAESALDRGGVVLRRGGGLLDEFKAFVLRGNVVDLAVAVVIAQAFQAVVQSMVNDIILPIVGIVGGADYFKDNSFSIRGSIFRWGNFLTQLISFLIVAAVVFFFVVKPMNLLLTRMRVVKETSTGTETGTETAVKDGP